MGLDEAPTTHHREPDTGSLLPAEREPPVEAPPIQPPSLREAIGRSLDLALAASDRVRRTSVYIGLLTLGALAAPTILGLVLIRDLGGVQEFLDLIVGFRFASGPILRAAGLLSVSGLLSALVLGAVLFEAQILAAIVLGNSLSGRRRDLFAALALSRRVFWHVVAAGIVVGLLRTVAGQVVVAVMHPQSAAEAQETFVAQLVIQTLVTAPFAFYLASIVLGGAGALEALKRSVRVAGKRWRLAFLVASAGAAVSLIQVFALGAATDIVARVATAVGLSLFGPPPVAVLTGGVVLAGLVALGSLYFTVLALSLAPQVVVFVGLTGATDGLDRALADHEAERHHPPRLVTIPMIAIIVFAATVALAGLAVVWSNGSLS
jgi:hypothetical protein